MHLTKEYLLVIGIVTLFAVSLFCGHFDIAVTGGHALNSELPSSGWDIVTSGLTWFGDMLTFQVTSGYVLVSTILWIWIICTILIPVALIIRGV